jgi:hypothetical protein
MMESLPFDWTQYATGGATRPDSFTGMKPAFSTALQQMFASAPPEIQSELQVASGYRSPERQAQLWAEALAKYGSPEEARKWVAPPGNSQHNHGNAADLRYLSPAAQAWVHANAQQYGLAFPLGNEPWHVELAGARGGPAGMPPAAMPTNALAPAPQNAFAAAPQQPPQNALAALQPVQLDPRAFMTSRLYSYQGKA